MLYTIDEDGQPFLLLMGGVDINPAIYGHQRHHTTQRSNDERDLRERRAFAEAIADNVPIVGICRGSQLLCALNGGSIYQHTRDHGYSHPIQTTTGDGVIEHANAGHHQVSNPNAIENHVVLAYDPRETIEVEEADGKVIEVGYTAEVVFYPITKSLGIQPHPEGMHKACEFNQWLRVQMDTCLGIKYNLGRN